MPSTLRPSRITTETINRYTYTPQCFFHNCNGLLTASYMNNDFHYDFFRKIFAASVVVGKTWNGDLYALILLCSMKQWYWFIIAIMFIIEHVDDHSCQNVMKGDIPLLLFLITSLSGRLQYFTLKSTFYMYIKRSPLIWHDLQQISFF